MVISIFFLSTDGYFLNFSFFFFYGLEPFLEYAIQKNMQGDVKKKKRTCRARSHTHTPMANSSVDYFGSSQAHLSHRSHMYMFNSLTNVTQKNQIKRYHPLVNTKIKYISLQISFLLMFPNILGNLNNKLASLLKIYSAAQSHKAEQRTPFVFFSVLKI